MTASVDQLIRLLDAVAREYGTLLDDLSTDGDARRLLALQLVARGVACGAPPPVDLPRPPQPGDLEAVQARCDTLELAISQLRAEVHVLWQTTCAGPA